MVPRSRSGVSSFETHLRSLGAALDVLGARRVVIDELPEGLLVRAWVASPLGDASVVPLERWYRADDALRVESQRAGLRHTGYGSGPLERDLRLLGRQIQLLSWSDVSLVEDGDDWLVRHRLPGPARHALVRIDRAELRRIEDEAVAARRRPLTLAS